MGHIGISVDMSQTETKGDRIEELLMSGEDYTVNEIMEEVGCSQSRVYQVKSNLQESSRFRIGQTVMNADSETAKITEQLTPVKSDDTMFMLAFDESGEQEVVSEETLIQDYILLGGDNA